MALVELNNIHFKYHENGNDILSLSEFQIQQGEKIFLYGPSGCGKTTFLEIIAGVLVPQSGQYRLLSQDILKMSSSDRDQMRAAHIGYIFQSFNLIPYLSVEENILLPLYLSEERRKKIPVATEKKKAHQLCQQLGIDGLLARKVTELSVGQQQRVAVARALLGSPELI